MQTLTENRTRLILLTLLCLFPVTGMAIDLIAPSLPAIAKNLQISEEITKAIIYLYLIGYGLGNFFMGFLTDALGRRWLIRLASLGFVVASMMPLLSPSAGVLLSARLLQGIMMGAVAVLSRAILTDVLSPEKLLRMGTIISTMWGIGPIIGPIIGGYLQFYFGWQANFCFFSVLAFVECLLIFFVIPETHLNRQPLNIKTILTNSRMVISHPVFMGMTLFMGLSYSLIVVFHTSAPFLIQNTLHFSPVFFGHLALILGVVFLVATFVCRFMLDRYEAKQWLQLVFPLFLMMSFMGIFVGYFKASSVEWIAIISGVMFFACGCIFPAAMGSGLSLFRSIAGTAGAIMYLINISISSLVTFLASLIKVDSAIPLVWSYFVLLAVMYTIYLLLVRRYTG